MPNREVIAEPEALLLVTIDDISAYYMAEEIRGLMRGMVVAILDEQWQRQFGQEACHQLANLRLALPKQVDLE